MRQIQVGELYHRYAGGGLGDWITDCLAQIASYPGDYVFGGSRFSYSATGGYTSSIPFARLFGDFQARIQNNVMGAGYQQVSASVQSPIVGEFRATVTGVAPVDQNSANDIRGTIDEALKAAGIQPTSSTISISRPDPNSICSGRAAAGGGGPAPGSPADCGFGCQLQRLWEGNRNIIIIGGVAVAAVMLLRK